MASSFNIKNENICRTCMSKEDLLSMFDISYDTMTLDLVISAITGVKIGLDDGLPSTICLICKEKAITAFEFKRKSQDVDVTLRGIFKKEKLDLELDRSTYEHCDQIKTELNVADDQLEGQDDWSTLDDLEDMAMVKNEDESHDPGHQCKNCTTVFESYKKYQEHLRKKCVKVEMDDANNNYCPLCGTFYYNAVDLTKHMWDSHTDLMGPKKRGRPRKLMTGAILSKLNENGFHLKSIQEKKHSCSFCNEEFKTKEDTHIHQMEHKDSKLLFCLFCKKSYLKKKYFDCHVCIETKNTEDNIKQVNEEENNKQDFLSEITLQELLDPYDAEENNRVVQVCPVCTGVFRSEEELADHNDNEHPELSLRCNLCSKMFATVKSASRHRNICKQVERKFRCSTCGLKFAYELSLNKHILRYHEGQSVSVAFIDTKSKETRQYKCDNCSKVFGRKEALIKHSKIHSDKLYECDVCKKKFNRSDNLRSHKRTHEPRTKMTTCLCLYCGRSFNNSSNLIVHMRRHTGEKPYKCDYCGKGFPRSSDLQCHRRSHTGEKPCICGVCGKGFSRSNKLSRHMRVHTGVKPYKCTFCEKAFSQSNDLTLHVRRHTGDKPYICEICGERFIQGTALHNHRRTHGHFPPSSSDSQLHTITYTVQCINPQE